MRRTEKRFCSVLIGAHTKKQEPPFGKLLHRLLIHIEMLGVAANAHFKTGIDFTFFFSAAKNKPLAAMLAAYRYFHPHRVHHPIPTVSRRPAPFATVQY